MTSTVNQSGAIIPSISSSHSSSGSQDFSLSQPGESGGHGPSPSRRPTPRTSTTHFRSATVTTNPEDYFLPGVSPDTYTTYAIAGARIYHSTQLGGHHTRPLGFSWGHGGGGGGGGGGGSSSKDKNSGGQWAYSHLKGTLVFGRDKPSAVMHTAAMSQPVLSNTPPGPVATPPTPSAAVVGYANASQGDDPTSDWWFQLVDDATGKIAWKFKIPLSLGNAKFNYELDRPFFHVFRGSSRKYGFLFDDDKEATTFSTEVISKITAALAATSKPPKNRSRNLSIRTTKKFKSKATSASSASSSSSPSTTTQAVARPGGISISMISSPKPDSFKHVGHVGVNSTSGSLETSKDLDPSFREILSDLRLQSGTNVTESVVLEHLDFVQGFWKDIDSLQRNGSTSRPVAAN